MKPKENLLVGKSIAVEKGSAEALVIASRSPLKKAVKALQTLAQEQNRDSDPIDINREPVKVINDLLDDLSVDRGGINVQPGEVKAADIATLSISFEVE
ncbi:MAG: hypothetical protein DSM106950_06725 [Stigonema ocellatum SAG 48.90 = DSM 106950]|nr:hypothetical protein [Stigonema ocellatum SAG 48.90 = DSM 106950]